MTTTRSAAWRDGEGNTVATVWGGTACLNPRHPRDLSAATEDRGFEHVMRCRDCDGCRRYENLLLRRRLAEHFKSRRMPLWMIEFRVPLDSQAGFANRVSRTRLSTRPMGFYRLTGASFAVVVSGKRPQNSALRGLSSSLARIRRIARVSSLRSYRILAAGMLVPRAKWGRQVKRFYHRGLPQLPKETFYVERRGGIRKRHPEARQGHRAWRDGLTLYPSDRARFSEFIELVRRSSRHDSRNSFANRGARKRASFGGEVVDRGDAAGRASVPAATAHLRTDLDPSKSGRDASSRSEIPRWLADWEAKMVARARDRGP